MVLNEDPKVEVKLSYTVPSGYESDYTLDGYQLTIAYVSHVFTVYLEITFQYKGITYTRTMGRLL